MKAVGIVAEYNPFHTGHFSHLERSKEISGTNMIIVVMSGNFVQRGEPACMDKWRRTKTALENGADMVIELPLSIATASAGYFAQGAVNLLKKTGIVDCMCFGSECGDINMLEQYANALSSEDQNFKNRLKLHLGMGLSYPAARAKAAMLDLPDTPNDVLGVEYIKSLKELKSNIVPLTVLRSPGSAMEVRACMKKRGDDFACLDNLSNIFHYVLHTNKNLHSILDVSEGLENRLKKCAKSNKLISEIIESAKTKRYTYLRLQRAALHMILGITSVQEPQYIRVLGFRKKSENLLGMLEERASLPIVMNIKNAKFPMLDEEIQSTKIYSLAFNKHMHIDEYVMPLIVV